MTENKIPRKESVITKDNLNGEALTIPTLKSLGNCEHKKLIPPSQIFPKMNYGPITTTKRVIVEKTWKISTMAFQGQRCDHLAILLASHLLGCVP